MAIDAKKTLEKLRGEQGERARVSLYLDKKLYEDFRKSCSDVAPSKVMEELMREFIASAKPTKKSKK